MSPFPVLKEADGDLDRYKLLLLRHEKFAEANSLLQHVDEDTLERVSTTSTAQTSMRTADWI